MAVDIFSLRPTDASSTAISAAIDRANAALAAAESQVRTALQERDAALLDADPKALTALERRLTEARAAGAEVSERVGAVLAQLEVRFATTSRAETLATVQTAKVATEDAGRALVTWWNKAQPKLAALLGEGATLNRAAGEAYSTWATLSRQIAPLHPDAVFEPPAPTRGPADFWQDAVREMVDPAEDLPPPTKLTAEEEAELAKRAEARQRATDEYAYRNGHFDQMSEGSLARISAEQARGVRR